MVEQMLVVGIVGLAVFYMGRSLYRMLTGSDKAGG